MMLVRLRHWLMAEGRARQDGRATADRVDAVDALIAGSKFSGAIGLAADVPTHRERDKRSLGSTAIPNRTIPTEIAHRCWRS
jgi:hypothetical protein